MSCIPARKTIPITSSCACNQPRGMSHVAWFGRPMTPRNIPELPPERGLGNPAVARNQVGGKDAVPDEPLAFAVELRCDLVGAPTGPWRQRRVVQHPGGGTGRGPRRRRCGRRLAEAPECRPREGGEREHGRLPPQDLRSRDRRHGHRLRPRRRCASDQRRSSRTRRRRAGSRARCGRRRPRPLPHRPLSRDDHRRRHGFIACDCAANRVRHPGGLNPLARRRLLSRSPTCSGS